MNSEQRGLDVSCFLFLYSGCLEYNQSEHLRNDFKKTCKISDIVLKEGVAGKGSNLEFRGKISERKVQIKWSESRIRPKFS